MAKHKFPFDMRKIIGLFRWDPGPEGLRRKKFPCIFCDDHNKHLSIDFINDTYLCYRCGNHGGMLDLYRYYFNLGLDNAETTERIKRELNLATDERSDNRPAERDNQVIISGEDEDNPTTTRSDAELDEVYRAFLEDLPLFPEHQADLKKRGLTDSEIREDGYKSVPRSHYQDHARRLLNKGLRLDGIPGFFTIKRSGRWSIFVPAEGFFVPIRNLAHQITGLQIRMDKPIKHRKYVWFSSNKFKGHRLQGGTKVRVDLHHVGNFDGGLLGFTEGGLKANVTYHLYNRLPGVHQELSLIAYQGVGALANLESEVAALGSSGFTQVMEMNDRDKIENTGVRVATGRLYSMVDNALCNWPYTPDCLSMHPDDYLGKGMDDHILEILKHGADAGRFSRALNPRWMELPPLPERTGGI